MRGEIKLEQFLEQSLQPLLARVSTNGVFQGIGVILITLVSASFFTWLTFLLIRKVTARTRFDLDDQIARILRPPVYFTLLVSGFSVGIRLMELPDTVHLILVRCLKSGGVIIWTFVGAQLAHLLLTRVALLSKKVPFIQQHTVTLFDNLAKVVIFTLGIYFIFHIWAIDMTAWLASAGIVGIAVGFAAKDTLANLFSGVFILADAPYKIGDYVVFENGGRGKVTHIGLRSTRMLTRDDVEVTIPNSIIGNSRIINQSGGPHEKFRIRIKIGVAYGSDIDQVRRILLTIADLEPLVCRNPVARVRFRLFSVSSVDFELLCWVSKPELRGRATDALCDSIYKAFQKNGIEIPYAKQDLYIRELPKNSTGQERLLSSAHVTMQPENQENK